MVTVLEEYRTALAVEHAAVHRYLGEMARKGRDVGFFLGMVRAAHEQVELKRQALMTEVGT